jgi:hypothetical protein
MMRRKLLSQIPADPSSRDQAFDTEDAAAITRRQTSSSAGGVEVRCALHTITDRYSLLFRRKIDEFFVESSAFP